MVPEGFSGFNGVIEVGNAGFMAGAGKRVIVYIPEKQEPELMYLMFHDIIDDIDSLIRSIQY